MFLRQNVLIFLPPSGHKKTNTALSFLNNVNIHVCSVNLFSHLCPCSGSCLHLEAPELRRSLWTLHWELQPWTDLRERKLTSELSMHWLIVYRWLTYQDIISHIGLLCCFLCIIHCFVVSCRCLTYFWRRQNCVGFSWCPQVLCGSFLSVLCGETKQLHGKQCC